MISEDKGSNHFRYFDGISDFLEYAQGPIHPDCVGDEEFEWRSSRKKSTGWAGCSFDQAVEHAKYGWPEGRGLMLDISDRVYSVMAGKMLSHEVAYDVAGDQPDVGRFNAGDPECMMHWEETNRLGVGRIIRVCMSIAGSAAVSKKQFNLRGAAVMAMLDLFERQGMRTEFWICSPVEHGGDKLVCYVPIKLPGEVMDPDAVAFFSAHPAALRRLMFAAREREPRQLRRTLGIQEGRGYGSPCDIDASQWDIYVGSLTWGEFENEKQVLKWVEDKLKEKGVEIEVI